VLSGDKNRTAAQSDRKERSSKFRYGYHSRGYNDLKKRNLDFVMGDVYELVSTAKKKLPNCKLVLSGVLRSRDVSWRRIGALNYRFGWEANALGLTFVDPNRWIEDGDFARDGLHLNGRRKSRLRQLYARVSGLDVGGSAESKK
jgi:hypothetical protein